MRTANAQPVEIGGNHTASAGAVPDDPHTRQIVFHIPLTIKRRCGRKQIITPGGKDLLGKDMEADPSDSSGSTDLSGLSRSSGYAREPLSIAVARAHRWLELIERGDYKNVQALACAIRLDRSYIHRLIRLTLLRPDLVEAILDNRDPGGMSIEKLWAIPKVWGEQGAVFGDG